MRRRNVRVFGQSEASPLRRRNRSDDDHDDRVHAEEMDSRLAAYSLNRRAPTAEELRSAFRRPPVAPETEVTPDTFATRFTTESLFVTGREAAWDPHSGDASEPTVDLAHDADDDVVIDLTAEGTSMRRNAES